MSLYLLSAGVGALLHFYMQSGRKQLDAAEQARLARLEVDQTCATRAARAAEHKYAAAHASSSQRSQTVIERLQGPYGLHEALAREIAAHIQLIVRDFVAHWYNTSLGGDPEFLDAVGTALSDIFGQISLRVASLDVVHLVTDDVIAAVSQHLRWHSEMVSRASERSPHLFAAMTEDALLARASARVRTGQSDKELIQEEESRLAQERGEKVNDEYQSAGVLHPACTTQASGYSATPREEWVYLRTVSAQMLQRLLPPAEARSTLLQLLLREVLTTCVLRPLMANGDSDYVNILLVDFLQAAHIPATGASGMAERPLPTTKTPDDDAPTQEQAGVEGAESSGLLAALSPLLQKAVRHSARLSPISFPGFSEGFSTTPGETNPAPVGIARASPVGASGTGTVGACNGGEEEEASDEELDSEGEGQVHEKILEGEENGNDQAMEQEGAALHPDELPSVDVSDAFDDEVDVDADTGLEEEGNEEGKTSLGETGGDVQQGGGRYSPMLETLDAQQVLDMCEPDRFAPLPVPCKKERSIVTSSESPAMSSGWPAGHTRFRSLAMFAMTGSSKKPSPGPVSDEGAGAHKVEAQAQVTSSLAVPALMARVAKAAIHLEKKDGPAFDPKAITRYTVHVRLTLPPGTKGWVARWAVKARYSQFHDLHMAIKKAFPDFSGNGIFPPKVTLTLASQFDHEFVDKRRAALDSWLHSIMGHPVLRESREVRTFVQPHQATDVSIAPLEAQQNRSSIRTARAVVDPAGIAVPGTVRFAPGIAGAEAGGRSSSQANTPAPAGRARRTSNRKQGRVLLLPADLARFESRVFALMSDVFDLETHGWLRRQVVGAVRSMARLLYHGAAAQQVATAYRQAVSVRSIARMLRNVRTMLWPGGTFRSAAPVTTESTGQQFDSAKWEVRTAARVALLAAVPTSLHSLLGKETCDTGAIRVWAFLQHKVALQSLLYTLLDLLLLRLMPDIVVHGMSTPPPPPRVPTPAIVADTVSAIDMGTNSFAAVAATAAALGTAAEVGVNAVSGVLSVSGTLVVGGIATMGAAVGATLGAVASLSSSTGRGLALLADSMGSMGRGRGTGLGAQAGPGTLTLKPPDSPPVGRSGESVPPPLVPVELHHSDSSVEHEDFAQGEDEVSI